MGFASTVACSGSIRACALGRAGISRAGGRRRKLSPGVDAIAPLERARALYVGDLLTGPDVRRYAWLDDVTVVVSPCVNTSGAYLNSASVHLADSSRRLRPRPAAILYQE